MNEVFTSADIRNKNKTNVLRQLIIKNLTTIGQIATDCNSTPVTIAKIMQDLQNEGVVVATKNDVKNVGRHGLTYSINPDLGVFVCFDLTISDRLEAYVFDIRNTVIEQIGKNTDGDSPKAFRDLNEEITAKYTKVLGVGVSIDGIYDSTTDKIISTLFDWYQEISFGRFLRQVYGTANIYIGQDVAFAALAEGAKLITNDKQSLYFLSIGDGLGGAFLKGHSTHEGVDGLAGEIGHILVDDNQNLNRLEDYHIIHNHKIESPENLRQLNIFIYNIIWLLNPDYFVVFSNEKGLADEVIAQAKQFVEERKPKHVPLTTKFLVSRVKDATVAGIIHKLVSRYLLSL